MAFNFTLDSKGPADDLPQAPNTGLPPTMPSNNGTPPGMDYNGMIGSLMQLMQQYYNQNNPAAQEHGVNNLVRGQQTLRGATRRDTQGNIISSDPVQAQKEHDQVWDAQFRTPEQRIAREHQMNPYDSRPSFTEQELTHRAQIPNFAAQNYANGLKPGESPVGMQHQAGAPAAMPSPAPQEQIGIGLPPLNINGQPDAQPNPVLANFNGSPAQLGVPPLDMNGSGGMSNPMQSPLAGMQFPPMPQVLTPTSPRPALGPQVSTPVSQRPRR